ncbi:MAG: hypothetical protein IPK64_14840 [bacterium]|nr:hypothetical protein [bacterium]
MRRKYVNRRGALAALGACLLLAGCSPSYYRQAQVLAGAGDHAGAVTLYYRELEKTPASHAAWREMGVSMYEQGDLDRAEEALKQAAAMRSEARTHLYLGLVFERRGNAGAALRAYGHALGLAPHGTTRDLLDARIAELTTVRLREEAQRSLAHEEELATATLPDSTVAVVEFADSGLPAELTPLTRGLAEFTALDLGKVKSLRVVDRLKIDALRSELALSQTEFADPATAPRIGRLVGGRRIVTGTLLGVGDQAVRLDGAVVDTGDQSVTSARHAEGPLAEIFRVQKQFVFDVIATMGIELTAQERNDIEKVPTENYLAFLAYCRGLELRDGNDLAGAQVAFQEATAADKGFTQAADQNRTVSTLLSTGLGANADFGQFSSVLGAASAGEIALANLGAFPNTLTGWNGFVPFSLDQGSWGRFADSPPHAPIQTSVNVLIRGDLDGQP